MRRDDVGRALLVAIEGIDGSGKGTQSAALCERLGRSGRAACILSFPRYQQTHFGAAIGQFLDGRFGSLDDVHPQLAAVLFACDRFESRDMILKAAADHDVVIFDRYVASNMAHQAARLDEPQRSHLARWIETIEYEVFGVPPADLTILLDLPAAMAQALIATKAQRSYTDKPADLQEADTGYLDRVRQMYVSLARQQPRWGRIDCLRDSSLRSVENIADELFDLVDRRLTDRSFPPSK